MIKPSETVTVKYKPHGILKKVTKFDSEESKQVFDCWQFESDELSIDYGEGSLVYVLDELSIEGWDLVCHSEEEGFIFRKQEEKEDTIKYYDESDIKNMNE